jgi:hypothetical protein
MSLIVRGMQEAGSKVDANGNKAMQTEDKEDRDYEYRKWRMSWGPGLVVNIDQVEAHMMVDDSFKVKGILELSRRDPHPKYPGAPPPFYFKQIYDRQIYNNLAVKFIRALAIQLHCPCYYVLYHKDLSRFYVQDLIAGKNMWHSFGPDDYKRLILSLPNTELLGTSKGFVGA